MSAFIFCLYCQSSAVDIQGWDADSSRATFRCSSCGHESQVEGFTLGRPYPREDEPEAKAIPRLVTLAALDMAIPPGSRGAA